VRRKKGKKSYLSKEKSEEGGYLFGRPVTFVAYSDESGYTGLDSVTPNAKEGTGGEGREALKRNAKTQKRAE